MKWLALFLAMAVTVQAQRITSGDSTNKNGGLVGWWPLCETNGVVFPDLSGNGNNGTNVNGITLEPGKIGKAGRFNGSSQYVQSGASAFTNQPSGTIAGWVNILAYNTTGDKFDCLMEIKGGGANTNWMSLVINSGDYGANHFPQFQFRSANNTVLFSSNNIPLNTWTHMAIVSTSSNYLMYLNGVVVPLTVGNGANNGKWFSSLPSDSYATKIGIHQGATLASYFNGLIDEVLIYNRALSASEISAMYFNQRKQFWSAQ